MWRSSLFFVIFVVFFLWIVVAYSQTQLKKLYDPAFKDHQRPPVEFYHDRHNQKASLFDCSVCHHLYKDGKLIKGAMSIGMRCSDCHRLKGSSKNRISLMEAYHGLCIGCHREKKKGPITCGECHKKSR